MAINIRSKGANGERELCTEMNWILAQVMRQLGYPEDQCLKAMSSVQRNQNQTAVGGNDLANTFGLSIEVKRQETLSVNAWWKQCEAAADRNGEVPVLLYRQNRGKWRCVTYVWVDLPGPMHGQMRTRAEFDFETFKAWWAKWVEIKLNAGAEVRT